MTTSQPTEQFQTRMAALNDKFRERSMEQYHHLVSLTETKSPAVDELEAIRKIAHSLAGSAGLFGYDKVARQAATVEDEILAKADSNTVVQQVCALCSLIQSDVVIAP
ncbi:Hpt domain-containing protein [Fulvimarina sp. MAC8]|uniref:Hpt domain-containing protein n=1 Tax=Fulvimarina sp. MAC8 TaxID=3162874 RepID=UPI0032EEA5ED